MLYGPPPPHTHRAVWTPLFMKLGHFKRHKVYYLPCANSGAWPVLSLVSCFFSFSPGFCHYDLKDDERLLLLLCETFNWSWVSSKRLV